MPHPGGRLSSSNSLPPGQEKKSNARGMPGGGCLSFDLTGTLRQSKSIKSLLGVKGLMTIVF